MVLPGERIDTDWLSLRTLMVISAANVWPIARTSILLAVAVPEMPRSRRVVAAQSAEVRGGLPEDRDVRAARSQIDDVSARKRAEDSSRPALATDDRKEGLDVLPEVRGQRREEARRVADANGGVGFVAAGGSDERARLEEDVDAAEDGARNAMRAALEAGRRLPVSGEQRA